MFSFYHILQREKKSQTQTISDHYLLRNRKCEGNMYRTGHLDAVESEQHINDIVKMFRAT